MCVVILHADEAFVVLLGSFRASILSASSAYNIQSSNRIVSSSNIELRGNMCKFAGMARQYLAVCIKGDLSPRGGLKRSECSHASYTERAYTRLDAF